MGNTFFYTGNDTVDLVGGINLEGNVIPHLWYQNLITESGKPDIVSVVLLAEIVYWHRPTQIKDPQTGMVKGAKKKFKEDMLQRSYESFANQFGFSKRQVKDAFVRLEKSGVLKRVFRTIQTSSGPVSNVLYIDLNGEAVQRITQFRYPYDVLKSEGCLLKEIPLASNGGTYTEITSDIVSNSSEQEQGILKPEEQKKKPEPKPNAFIFYQENFGILGSYLQQKLGFWIDDFEGREEIVIEAMKIALEAQKNFAYAEGVMKKWYGQGLKTLEEVKAAQVEYKRELEGKAGGGTKRSGRSGTNWDDIKKGLTSDED